MSALEKTCLIALLGVTGLACAALASPGLVVLGFFLLILPGLILSIAPVIALYGWLFAAPYAAFRTFGIARWGASLLALLFLLGFGLGRPAQINATTRAALATAVADDLRPARPVTIGGTVALVRDDRTGGWHQNDNSCDDLCLRLLYNGNAKIVYLGQRGRPGSAFSVERRTVCPPFAFSTDVVKWHKWAGQPASRKRIDWPPPLGLKEVVEARIAGGDCLVRVSGPVRPDWMIERIALPRPGDGAGGWSLAPGMVRGERITVYRREASGMRPVGRFTHAYAALLSMPLMPTVVGGIENSSWAWDRTTVGDSRWDWDSVTALRRLVAFNADLPEGVSPARMRELLAVALADAHRAPNDAGLLLANSVMVDIARTEAKPGDAALLARAIADDRFTKIDLRYEIAKKLGADYSTIADSAIARLSRLPDSDAATFPVGELNSIIALMPKEWFASPPAALTAILRDPLIAERSERTIGKLDAGGAAAVPLLTEIITSGVQRESNTKGEVNGHGRANVSDGVHAAVAALCRIGTPARSALGTIIAAKQMLFRTEDPWPDPNPGKYSAIWRGHRVNDGFVVTMVDLGVPIAQFRAPDQPSSTVNGSWAKMILLGVKDHDCKL